MITDGWLNSAQRIPTTHHNERPEQTEISLLVIHNISLPPEQFGDCFVEDFFCGNLDCSIHPYFEEIADLRVSSHLYIKRDGTLIQFVPFDKRAWHAGDSCFNGKTNCNDFSIGIELEGSDEKPFEPAQYKKLTQVTKELMKEFPAIQKDNIAGHSDIAPGRKTDPGEFFDWGLYFSKL